MCMCGTGILLGFVNAREVGVSSRNLVSRTFPQIFRSMLTPMWATYLELCQGLRSSSNLWQLKRVCSTSYIAYNDVFGQCSRLNEIQQTS